MTEYPHEYPSDPTWRDAWRKGYWHARIGIRLITALTSPNPMYRSGYIQGQRAAREERSRL
jgi:hypothetical protein